MQIKTITSQQLSKSANSNSTPTVLVTTEVAIKKPATLKALPTGLRERAELALARQKDPLKPGARIALPVFSKDDEEACIAVAPKSAEAFFLLEFARDTLKGAVQPATKNLRIIYSLEKGEEPMAEAFGAALGARIFVMPVYGKRAKDVKPFQLSAVELVASKKSQQSFEYGLVTAQGTNLARELATLPPNFLNPKTYGERIRELAKENGLSVKFHSKADLKKMGAGAFVAVDQGNPDSVGGIYELDYAPKGKPRKTIHLAGKGMCYDTGGHDIKTGGNMLTMKGDMQGSAVALGALIVAAKLKLPYRMKAFLAVTENHISPKAYKADEVVTALNGLSIEVVNTDAEGRMVLADTLTLASRGKPHCVIDFATLTGSAVRALGTKYAAGFTNKENLHDKIKAAGKTSGERVWTFPTDSTYDKALESKVADTLQCVKAGGPDHILASVFLSKFIEEGSPWVHIDLCPSENEGGIGHVDSMFTGFGVRWCLEFMKAV